MAEEKNAKTEADRLPYVKPKILTLKVDLSFASTGTELAHPEQAPKAKAARTGKQHQT